MNYIDAKKLRAEVERIKESGCESPISVCNDILSFIDTLQQEQDRMRYCIEYINPQYPLLDNGKLNIRHFRATDEHGAEMALTLMLSFGTKIYALYRGNVKEGKLGEWPTPAIVDSGDWYSIDWLNNILDCRRNIKDYHYVPSWRVNKENNKPKIKHSILMFTTLGVAEGEWDGNEWIQYRWSCTLKDSDVLCWIHLEDLQRLETEGDHLQHEHSGVNLEKEMSEYFEGWRINYNSEIEELLKNNGCTVDVDDVKEIARHFYELGLNSRKQD